MVTKDAPPDMEEIQRIISEMSASIIRSFFMDIKTEGDWMAELLKSGARSLFASGGPVKVGVDLAGGPDMGVEFILPVSSAERLKVRDSVTINHQVKGYTITKIITDEHSRQLRRSKGFRRHVRRAKAAAR